MISNTSDKPLDLSIIIPCMGRAEHVLENLSHLQNINAQVIVVDYSCPQGIGDAVADRHPSVDVARVADKDFFCPSDARNVGLEKAICDWAFFLDADIVLDKNLFADNIIFSDFQQFYLLGRMRELGACGSLLAPTEAVRALGGYDLRYHGYGGEDLDMFERLALRGLKLNYLANQPARILPHSVDDRVRYFAEKNRAKSLLINRVYSHLKMNLFRLSMPRQPSEKELDQLRAFCEQRVEKALAEGHSKIEITMEVESFSAKYFPESSGLRESAKKKTVQRLDCSFQV